MVMWLIRNSQAPQDIYTVQGTTGGPLFPPRTDELGHDQSELSVAMRKGGLKGSGHAEAGGLANKHVANC
jgi:hypothetical protein